MSYNHQQNRRAPQRYASSSSPSSSSAPAATAISAFADWATRSLDPELRVTPVQSYVERCCDPMNSQPNLALNLELADYIKQKQANTPREAAFAVVQRINSRHPQVSLLALDLLDHLVKNVGYPIHLQVATKEFLNELVKRFPERPPLFPSSAQTKILALIHEWKHTICVDSKRKDDLGHIRDMHKLLTYKGYRFPSLDARSKGVLNPENALQTPEELEEEDRSAQAAKLQELIRRGTPRDLEQAQELMKVMSGAEPENKPDYASQTVKELDRVQARAILLNDMLNNHQAEEKFVRGDAYDQIGGQLRGLQPKLQRWISAAEDGQSSEQLDRLLLLNDLVNQVCERYAAFRRGDFSAMAHIDPSIDPAKGGASAVPTAKISDLISFDEDGDAPQSATSNDLAASTALDDFASLTFEPAGTEPTVGNVHMGPGHASSSFGLFDPTKLSKPPVGPHQTPSSLMRGDQQPPGETRSSKEARTANQAQSQGKDPVIPVSGDAQRRPQGDSAKDPFEDLLA